MIKKLQSHFGTLVKGLQTYKTPGTPGQGVRRPREGDEVLDSKMQSLYRSGVGMLLFLLKHSRIDIGNAVRELTKSLSAATPAAYKEMLRVIKFVLDTKNLGLKICPIFSKDGNLEWILIAFTDADWAGDKDDRKSVMGFILFLNGCPIMWRSKQAQIVALSSAESEFIAVSECVKEIIFVVQILTSIGIPVKTPITVRVDNMGAIFMSENASSNQRTRHIHVRHRFVVELTEQKFIEVLFVSSSENLADGLTKNVSGDIYEKHTPHFVVDKSYLDVTPK